MNSPRKTREPQYHVHIDHQDERGTAQFGLHYNYVWNDDPRALVFSMSRYKFVAKMLAGRERVAELGCGDGMGARLVQQTCSHVTVTDFDPIYIDDIKQRMDPDWPLEAYVHDITAGPLPEKFDAIYTLDVMEHIPAADEPTAMQNILASLKTEGVLVVGIPSLASQEHAHPKSKEGHVNCKDGDVFKADLMRWFHNVFVFSMNDEVIHTGFFPMANYLLAVCCQPRAQD